MVFVTVLLDLYLEVFRRLRNATAWLLMHVIIIKLLVDVHEQKAHNAELHLGGEIPEQARQDAKNFWWFKMENLYAIKNHRSTTGDMSVLRQQRHGPCRVLKSWQYWNCFLNIPKESTRGHKLVTLHSIRSIPSTYHPDLYVDHAFLAGRQHNYTYLHTPSFSHADTILLRAEKSKCKLCKKMYASKEGLRAHHKRCHSPLIVSIKSKCKLCKKMYASKDGLRAHHKRCHSPLIVSIDLSKVTPTRQRDSEAMQKQPPQVDREGSESSSSVDSFKLVLDLDSADSSSSDDENCYSAQATSAPNKSTTELSVKSVLNNSSMNVSSDALVSNDDNLEWSAHTLHRIVKEHSYSKVNGFLDTVVSPQATNAENSLSPCCLNNAPWGIWRDQVTNECHWLYWWTIIIIRSACTPVIITDHDTVLNDLILSPCFKGHFNSHATSFILTHLFQFCFLNTWKHQCSFAPVITKFRDKSNCWSRPR